MLQGRLKVFYDFSGVLVELEPKDPSSEYLRISDADPKTVGLLPSKIQNLDYHYVFT